MPRLCSVILLLALVLKHSSVCNLITCCSTIDMLVCFAGKFQFRLGYIAVATERGKLS